MRWYRIAELSKKRNSFPSLSTSNVQFTMGNVYRVMFASTSRDGRARRSIPRQIDDPPRFVVKNLTRRESEC